MPSVNVAGVGVVNFPDTMSQGDIINAIERDILPSIKKPEPPSKERTFGEAFQDIGAGVVSGVGAITQLPGQLYGLATGDFEKSGLLGAGQDIQKYAQTLKSPGLLAMEQERAQKIQQAEKEGQLAAFKTAFSETISNPALLTNFLAEQAPNLIPALGAARIASAAAGARAGISAAVRTGAVQQGADIGAQAYEEVYNELRKAGIPEEEASGRALGYARATGASAAVISLLAQRLPGAKALEETLAGVQGPGGRAFGALRGALGETASEITEETGGKLAQNLALQQINPEYALTTGLGQTAGMAAIGGVGMGGISGALQRPATPGEIPPTTPPSAFAATGEEPEGPTPIPGVPALEAPEVRPPTTFAPPTLPPVIEPPPVELPPVAARPEMPAYTPPPKAVADMKNYFVGKPEDFGLSFAAIQNRDRSKPASIQQMTSIAAEPDYNRISVSRDFGSGAPVVISDVELNPAQMGKVDVVSASDGTKIPVQYAVLEAGQITPSNLADGSAVPQYADPAFAGIRPVAGNGRVAGLQKAYGQDTAGDYVQSLINDPAHGISPDVISGMKNPVLVRVMPKSSLTPDIADKGNVGGQLGMSPTEQAKIDMGRFDLAGVEFLADGSPTRKTLQQFIAAMPKEEQAALLNKQGTPNPMAKIRLANALFARAYANDALIDLYAEATDAEAQQILRGMAIAAAPMSELEGAGDYDIRKYVAKAAELAVNARRQGTDLATYAQQGDLEMDPLTQQIVQMFAANKNAPRRIGDALTGLAQEANKASTESKGGPDLFGNAPVGRSIQDIFDTLRSEPTAKAPIVEEAPPTPPAKPAKPERVEFVIDKDPADIAKEIKGMSLPKLTKWLIDNAPNSAAKAIAEKMYTRIKEFDQRGVPMSMRVMSGATRSAKALGKSKMQWGATTGISFRVLLNGANAQGKADSKTGTDYETIMHELLHVCTQAQLHMLPRNAQEVVEMERLLKLINAQIKSDVAANVTHPFIEKMQRVKSASPKSWDKWGPMRDIDEVLAWGLTDPEYQSYIATIRVTPKQSAFTKFAEVLRNLLGLDPKYQTALEQLAAISEDILTEATVDVAAITERYGTFLGTKLGPRQAPPGATVLPSEGEVESEMEIPEFIRRGAEGVAKKAAGQRTPPETAFEGVPEDLMAKIRPSFYPEKKTILDKVEANKDRFFQRMAQGIADQYRTIKDYSSEAYMMARLSKTIDGALEGLMFNGQVKLTDGALDIKSGTKGLIQALEPVGTEVDRYQIWVALSRDADLVRSGKISSFNKELVQRRNELAKGTLNGKSRLEIYEGVRKDMNALNKSVLDIALKQGLIDKEAYARFASDINYIPFYKAMEDGDIQGAATASGLANQHFSKELKGGEKPFGDLMENTLRNWSHILSASMKNAAAVKTVEAAVDMGAAFPNLKVGLEWRDGKVYSTKSGEMVGDGSLKPGYTTSGKGMAKVMMDGNVAYFEVTDPLLLDAIMSIGYMGPKSKFLDVAKDFKNILQLGVTVSPAFKVRNLFRDSISAMAVSDMKLNPFANIARGWALSNKNNPAHISALAGGAIFNFGSAYEGDQSKLIKRLLEMGVNESNILDTQEKIKAGLGKTWRAYQEFGNKSESANRMALYQQMRDKGMSHLEASFYARDLLDFSMQGSFPAFRMVTQVVPFLNARVQGLYKLGRDGIIPTSRVIYNSVTGKPIEATDAQKAAQFSTVTGAVVLASLALYMAFKDDDEFKKREQWDRDNFWWFRLPGMEAAIRVPKPFEIGAFGTMAERTLEQIIDSGAEGKIFEQSFKRMMSDTFALNPTPQMIKPLVDLYANKDSFTGAPIETAGMERLSKAERYSEATSPLAKALSQVSNVFLPEAAEMSPVQADYAIKSYFGWLGGTIAATSHYAVMPFSKGAYPDHNWAETASLGFVKSLPTTQSQYVTAFYENNKQISEAYADMRHYAELGQAEKVQEIIEKKGDKIAMAKFYDKTAKDMAKIRKAIQVITHDETMTGAEKKEEIDRLKLIIGDLAEQAETARKSMRK
jgi:hypothetical protein